MNILVDGQTLSSPDLERGIGRVLVQLSEELLPSDRSKTWYFAVRSQQDLEGLGPAARRIAIPLTIDPPAGGRDAVISENAGSGNADVQKRDLYFTITTPVYKLMTVLVGEKLRLIYLYDLQNDPDELDDLLAKDQHKEIVAPLIDVLLGERGELLEFRNAASRLNRHEWEFSETADEP